MVTYDTTLTSLRLRLTMNCHIVIFIYFIISLMTTFRLSKQKIVTKQILTKFIFTYCVSCFLWDLVLFWILEISLCILPNQLKKFSDKLFYFANLLKSKRTFILTVILKNVCKNVYLTFDLDKAYLIINHFS